MDVQFDFSSVHRMAAKYQGGTKIVMDETRKAISRAVIQIEGDAKRIVPTDTHTLQRSLTHQVTSTANSVTGRVGTNLTYALAVEEGRRAGAAMPPSGSLTGWMARKGIDARFEFVVRRAIGRRGIRARPYLKPAFVKNRAAISREMDQVLRRVSQRLAAGR